LGALEGAPLFRLAEEHQAERSEVAISPSDTKPGSAAGRSRTAHVAGEIGRAIVSGAYPERGLLPGDAELMQQFGVSRTVLREALRTLSGKGLIQARARVGTRVRPRAEWNLFDRDLLAWQGQAGLDAQFIAHLSEMRLALEPEAAALAAERRSNEELAGIFHHFDRMAVPNLSRADFARADLDFHLAIIVASHNPFLRSAAALIEVALIGLLTVSSPADDPDRLESSVADHRAIADAIANRNPIAAREAMRVVIGVGMRASQIGSPNRDH